MDAATRLSAADSLDAMLHMVLFAVEVGWAHLSNQTRKHLEDFDGRWVWLPKTMTFEEVEKRDGNESLQRSQRTAC